MADGLFGLFSPGTGQRIQRTGAALSGNLSQFDALAQQRRQQLSDERKKALVVDNRGVRRLLEANDPQGATGLLQDRIGRISDLGGDPSDSMQLLQQIQSGDIAGALSESVQLDNFAVDSGLLDAFPVAPSDEFIKTQGDKALFQTPSGQVEARTIEGLSSSDFASDKKVQSSKILPGGVVQMVFTDGTSEIRKATPEEVELILKAEERGVSLAQLKAGAKVTGKGQAERDEATINNGVELVSQVPILRRSLQLLERIETGGVDAASLRAKQLFGVEGADEGELSANLGRAVLSRLRETFGAAFTEREGARLERMSAGFGKSVETNKRLLRQALTLIQGSSDRALDAAQRTGDQAAIDQLLDFQEGRFDLTDESLAGIFNPTSQVDAEAPPVVPTVTEGPVLSITDLDAIIAGGGN
jgi:hypothetical protein